jgi:hypothetical protein
MGTDVSSLSDGTSNSSMLADGLAIDFAGLLERAAKTAFVGLDFDTACVGSVRVVVRDVCFDEVFDPCSLCLSVAANFCPSTACDGLPRPSVNEDESADCVAVSLAACCTLARS